MGLFPVFRRAHPVAASKAAGEICGVVEACLVGDLRDGQFAVEQ